MKDSKVDWCDFLIWTPPMRYLLKTLSTEATPAEHYYFDQLRPEVYSVSIMSSNSPFEGEPEAQNYYRDSMAMKTNHGVIGDLTMSNVFSGSRRKKRSWDNFANLKKITDLVYNLAVCRYISVLFISAYIQLSRLLWSYYSYKPKCYCSLLLQNKLVGGTHSRAQAVKFGYILFFQHASFQSIHSWNLCHFKKVGLNVFKMGLNAKYVQYNFHTFMVLQDIFKSCT